MQRISKLTLKNFKFFHGEVPIEFDRKNVLLFGENGSGKSSIYWALYTFLQSPFKTTDLQIEKYFNERSGENLINRFADAGAESLIEVTFEDEHKAVSSTRISRTAFSARTDNLVREAAQASDFLTYKLLSKLYDFKNSQLIDLFPIFRDEILQFITFRKPLGKADGTSGTPNAYDWWHYLEPGMNPRSKMHEAPYKLFKSAMDGFNDEFKYFLESITERVNEYLVKFGQKLKLLFEYTNGEYDAFEPGSTTKRKHDTSAPKIGIRIEWDHDKLTPDARDLDRPHIFLNEAKLTTIALAIRFAIVDEKLTATVAGADPPKLLILDDLLLSLDMSNRDEVLEVILTAFKDSQLFIMTHDRNFFEIARHQILKLDKDKWKLLEIYECAEDGVPQPKITESKTYLEKAEEYFHKHEYEIAANFLRKQAESFCEDFLPIRQQFRDDGSRVDLNGLIQASILLAEQSGLGTPLFEKLDDHRKFVLNPSSHDSFPVPKYRKEIEKCLALLKELKKIESKPVLKGEPVLIFELHAVDGKKWRFEITAYEETRLIKAPNKKAVLGPTRMDFKISTKGRKTQLKSARQSLKKMYDSNYEKSDKTKSADFWEEVVFKSGGAKLSSILS